MESFRMAAMPMTNLIGMTDCYKNMSEFDRCVIDSYRSIFKMSEVDKVYKMRGIVAESKRTNIECLVCEIINELENYNSLGGRDAIDIVNEIKEKYKSEGRFK